MSGAGCDWVREAPVKPPEMRKLPGKINSALIVGEKVKTALLPILLYKCPNHRFFVIDRDCHHERVMPCLAIDPQNKGPASSPGPVLGTTLPAVVLTAATIIRHTRQRMRGRRQSPAI